MDRHLQFYIDGAWVDPVLDRRLEVINPATEQPVATISIGGAEDVDRAVAAARRAFQSFAGWDVASRIALLERIVAAYEARIDDIARAITTEIGAPASFAEQARSAPGHLRQAIRTLSAYPFEETRDGYSLRREPIGVAGLITPWNWPINQIVTKLAYALAAGCTAVVKPSEVSPLSSLLLMQALHDAGVPPGVVNMVNGDGPGVGHAIAAHPGIDCVSFTGSTASGILVARTAAETVKRVTQELGGKSANVILPDADLAEAVHWGISRGFLNTGQSCQAPSRLLVHETQRDAAVAHARAAVSRIRVGDPLAAETTMGPVVNRAQFERVQRYIALGIEDGATLVAGGPGRPEGLDRGFFVQPTVFADVTPDMTIAREEIFGPVLSIISYRTEAEALEIANGTRYGLAAYVFTSDPAAARRMGAGLAAGRVFLNGAPSSLAAPMGGYRQSGNGRELGEHGLAGFLEVKALMGFPD